MKLVPGFSARYSLDKLVYYESTADVQAAIAREKQIKGWLRERKIALIESQNPEWKDLGIEYILGEPETLREVYTERRECAQGDKQNPSIETVTKESYFVQQTL